MDAMDTSSWTNKDEFEIEGLILVLELEGPTENGEGQVWSVRTGEGMNIGRVQFLHTPGTFERRSRAVQLLD